MATKADRFPKQYINAATVRAKPLVLVIDEETYEPITDRKTGTTTEKSVLSFQNYNAKLILNGTNFDLVCEVTGCTDSADWPGHEIELFCDRTSMGSERVDCVRVRAPQPAPKKKTSRTAPTKPAPALVSAVEEEGEGDVNGDVFTSEDAATLKAAVRDDLNDDIPF
jgi:hypothetical protein